MKQTIKYLILALLIPAAYCFTACDTDIEPIDQQIIKPDQQDPAQYAAYLAALKAYKASEHYIVYASLANAPAVPGSEKAFLRSLPDSLDIVALENAGNLTEYDIEDIPQAQAKGTLLLSEISDNSSESFPNCWNIAQNFRRSFRRSASACRFVMVRAEYLSPGCNRCPYPTYG